MSVEAGIILGVGETAFVLAMIGIFLDKRHIGMRILFITMAQFSTVVTLYTAAFLAENNAYGDLATVLYWFLFGVFMAFFVFLLYTLVQYFREGIKAGTNNEEFDPGI